MSPQGPYQGPVQGPTYSDRTRKRTPDSMGFLPAYIRARSRWGQLFDPSLAPVIRSTNPVLPSLSFNAPMGYDFQNFYPELYNAEKMAIATVLGTFNPSGAPTMAFRQFQYSDEIWITTNVNSFISFPNWQIQKDDPNALAWAICFSQQFSEMFFCVSPIGDSFFHDVSGMNQYGVWYGANLGTSIPSPNIGGWLGHGTFSWVIPSWVRYVKAYVTGAGGGGGAGLRSYSGANGGSAGGTAIQGFIVSPTMSPVYVQVGAGGYGYGYEGAAGANGGASQFVTADGTINLIGNGGAGGWPGGYHWGGDIDGGTSSGGVWNTRGGTGKSGGMVWDSSQQVYNGNGGSGGDSWYQGGGSGSFVEVSNVGSYPTVGVMGGGGGGGGSTGTPGSQTFWPGAYGGDGVVMVEYYA